MFSVGIPVRNEENNIGGLISDIYSQSLVPDEVLVCINNSTDSTKEKVMEILNFYDGLKLLESRPGKALAWNKIVSESINNKIIFCDGDIKLGGKDTFKNLLNKLIEEELTLLGGSIIQIPSKRIKPYKLSSPSGQLYGIDLDLLGFNKLPKGLINDDLYLTIRSGLNFDVTDESFFYANKPGLCDIVHTQLRILKGIKQILDLGFEKELKDLVEFSGRDKYKLAFQLSKLISYDKDDNLWKEALSTKKLIKR